MEFKTPEDSGWKIWLIIGALVIAYIGFIATAEAAEEQKEEVVEESSPCNRPLQIFKGLQLVSLQIEPESLQAVAIYYRKLEDGKILLFRLIRPSCEAGWQQAGVKVLEAPQKRCEDTDTQKCL